MTTGDLELWLKENNLVTSEANREFFNRATEGLIPYGTTGNDSIGTPIMPGTGPHCVQAFADAIALTKACSVLEIGTNLGHGSAVMLALGVCYVHSIDISERQETRDAANILFERYPDKFGFECLSSGEMLKRDNGALAVEFDFAFIDGGHEIEDVETDIALCRKLGIRNMLFDDWYPEYGPGVQSVIKVCGLKVRAIFGNMCLCSEI